MMKVTKDQILKWDRKFNREIELNKSEGWVAKYRVHRSNKTYNRKLKHSRRDY